MNGPISLATKTFRKKFIISNKKDIANWFPGHMAKGVKQMQNKLKTVDCIIEVHDARIPVSGRNPNFHHLLTAVKPKILVLNKVDTVFEESGKFRNEKTNEMIEMLARTTGDKHVVFTDCKKGAKDTNGVTKIVPTIVNLIKSTERFNREQMLTEYRVMIIGIPNVGKSSLINALRTLHLKKGKATRVGANPGVTRSVLERIKICEDPSIYLLDTPGIMEPNIKNVDVAMKLALCAAIEGHMIGITTVADYLLFYMNKMRNFSYVSELGMKEATDDINEVLLHMAITLDKYKVIRTPEDGSRVRHPDFDAVAHTFIRDFREGKFGKINLDEDIFQMDANCEQNLEKNKKYTI